MKLDLGCGLKTPEGFEGVDVSPLGQSWVVDLMKFPWPFADETYDELRSSHFCEHLPARDVEGRDIVGTRPSSFSRYIGQDFFFAFFDECHRILKPGGTMNVIVPAARSNGAFQDPTHRRFIMSETFVYLDWEWRRANGLEHYKARCDFHVELGGALLPGKIAPPAGAPNLTEWNFYAEWRAKLVKR